MGERLSVKMREMEEILVVRAGRGQDQMAFFFYSSFRGCMEQTLSKERRKTGPCVK